MKPHSTKVASLVLIGALLTGCAASPTAFYADPAAISDVKLCRTLTAAPAGSDPKFAADVWRALQQRGLDAVRCRALVDKQNANIAVGVAVGVAVAVVARKGGLAGVGVGVGVSPGAGAPTYDTDWDWDQFVGPDQQLVWSCRGIQTGQIVQPNVCTGKVQTDWRWPQK